MRIVGIVFARTDSARLPGKAFLPFAGTPLCVHVLQQVSRLTCLDHVVLATSGRDVDRPLCLVAQSHGFSTFCGSLEDVGMRALSCARAFQADAFVRFNGDSPFIDFDLISLACERFRASSMPETAFASNLFPQRSYPYGVAVEVVSTALYAQLCTESRTADEREHLTKVLYKYVEHTAFIELPACEPDSSSLRLTIDTPQDYERLLRLYSQHDADSTPLDYRKLVIS